jgi:hypothetical protein
MRDGRAKGKKKSAASKEGLEVAPKGGRDERGEIAN